MAHSGTSEWDDESHAGHDLLLKVSAEHRLYIRTMLREKTRLAAGLWGLDAGKLR